MNRLLENYEGILLHAHAGRDGGKIADIFTLSAGLVRIYVGKTVLERCGSGGMVSLRFFDLLRKEMARSFLCPSMRVGCFWT